MLFFSNKLNAPVYDWRGNERCYKFLAAESDGGLFPRSDNVGSEAAGRFLAMIANLDDGVEVQASTHDKLVASARFKLLIDV